MVGVSASWFFRLDMFNFDFWVEIGSIKQPITHCGIHPFWLKAILLNSVAHAQERISGVVVCCVPVVPWYCRICGDRGMFACASKSCETKWLFGACWRANARSSRACAVPTYHRDPTGWRPLLQNSRRNEMICDRKSPQMWTECHIWLSSRNCEVRNHRKLSSLTAKAEGLQFLAPQSPGHQFKIRFQSQMGIAAPMSFREGSISSESGSEKSAEEGHWDRDAPLLQADSDADQNPQVCIGITIRRMRQTRCDRRQASTVPGCVESGVTPNWFNASIQWQWHF